MLVLVSAVEAALQGYLGRAAELSSAEVVVVRSLAAEQTLAAELIGQHVSPDHLYVDAQCQSCRSSAFVVPLAPLVQCSSARAPVEVAPATCMSVVAWEEVLLPLSMIPMEPSTTTKSLSSTTMTSSSSRQA
jgi:hypothetical protein